MSTMLSLTHPGNSTSMVTQPHHLHTSHMRHLVAITNITHPNTLHTHDTTHIYMGLPTQPQTTLTYHTFIILTQTHGLSFLGGVGGTPKSTVLVHSFILCPQTSDLGTHSVVPTSLIASRLLQQVPETRLDGKPSQKCNRSAFSLSAET